MVPAKTKRRVAVIVVDNNSVDSTEAMVAKQFPWVQFQKLQENTGFAAANNRGISMVAAKYYLLLNSDIELTEHSNLDTLINFAAKRKDGGHFPRLVFSDGRTDMACHRGEPTLWASLSYFLGLESSSLNHQPLRNTIKPTRIWTPFIQLTPVPAQPYSSNKPRSNKSAHLMSASSCTLKIWTGANDFEMLVFWLSTIPV